MKVVATVTSKGQITVPKTVRQTLGLSKGDGIEFTVDRGRVHLRAVKPLHSSSGILHRYLPRGWKPPSAAEMDQGIARFIAERHRRR